MVNKTIIKQKILNKVIPIKYNSLNQIRELNKIKLIFTKNKYMLSLGIGIIILCLCIPFTLDLILIPLSLRKLVIPNL